MINHSSLPKSLWGEALKIADYIFNRVPSKAVAKSPYKLWTRKNPNIRHLHVWDCPIEARPYKLNERKVDLRIVRERSKGFKFYDPLSKSFFEMGNAKFIKDVKYGGSTGLRSFVFEDEYVIIPIVATKND